MHIFTCIHTHRAVVVCPVVDPIPHANMGSKPSKRMIPKKSPECTACAGGGVVLRGFLSCMRNCGYLAMKSTFLAALLGSTCLVNSGL